MRPAILNPLFAEVTVLKGVGPALAKPLERLGIARVLDVAFHLPTGWVDRVPRESLDAADAGRIIAITLTAQSYRQSGPRSPVRVSAVDEAGNHVSLVYFGCNGGWVKKLLPIGEARRVSGKLETYGQELQIVHPDYVVPLDEGPAAGGREAIYPVNIRVRANQRDGILRAIRRKVLVLFAKEGIALGTPTSTVVMQAAPDATAAQPPTSLTGS